MYGENYCGGYQSNIYVAHSYNNGTNWTVGTAATGVYDSRDNSRTSGGTTRPRTSSWPTPVHSNPATWSSPPRRRAGTTPPSSWSSRSLADLAFYAPCVGDLSYARVLPVLSATTTTTPTSTSPTAVFANNTWNSHLVTAWSGLANNTFVATMDSYFYNPSIVSTSNGTIYLSP